MFWVSTSPIHGLVSLSELEAYLPVICGSLPNANLLCCLNLLSKFGRAFQSQMDFDYFLGDIHYFPFWVEGECEGSLSFWDRGSRGGVPYISQKTHEVSFEFRIVK